MDRDTEITRMLLWFKAQLPPHEIGYWRFEFAPYPKLALNTDDRSIPAAHVMGNGMIVGYGACARCGKRIELERWANYSAYDNPESIAQGIERAQRAIRQKAEKAGECWGDVPRIPNPSPFVAVLDGVGQ